MEYLVYSPESSPESSPARSPLALSPFGSPAGSPHTTPASSRSSSPLTYSGSTPFFYNAKGQLEQCQEVYPTEKITDPNAFSKLMSVHIEMEVLLSDRLKARRLCSTGNGFPFPIQRGEAGFKMSFNDYEASEPLDTNAGLMEAKVVFTNRLTPNGQSVFTWAIQLPVSSGGSGLRGSSCGFTQIAEAKLDSGTYKDMHRHGRDLTSDISDGLLCSLGQKCSIRISARHGNVQFLVDGPRTP